MVDLDNDLKEYLRDQAFRNRIIEECARVAETYGWDNQHGTKIIPSTSANIAAAIRALKDKP